MELVDPGVERYAEAHTTPPTGLLAALAEETRATLEAPQMLTGTIEGRFLELLVFATGARRVLELGTYSGYSALSRTWAGTGVPRLDTFHPSQNWTKCSAACMQGRRPRMPTEVRPSRGEGVTRSPLSASGRGGPALSRAARDPRPRSH